MTSAGSSARRRDRAWCPCLGRLRPSPRRRSASGFRKRQGGSREQAPRELSEVRGLYRALSTAGIEFLRRSAGYSANDLTIVFAAAINHGLQDEGCARRSIDPSELAQRLRDETVEGLVV